MKALHLISALLLGICLCSTAQDNSTVPTKHQPQPLDQGPYVVMGRVVSGTLIANFNLNIGDIVNVAEGGKTMTVLKTGRKYPLANDEPNLLKLDERIVQLQEEVKKDVDEVSKLNDTIAKDEQEVKSILEKLDALLASVPQTNTIVFDRNSGTYVVTSNTGMSSEQQKLFNDLNNRMGALRKEMKQAQKRIPDSEAELDKDKKLLAKFEAEMANFKRENPDVAVATPSNNSKDLKERLLKLKSLFAESLITKEQYDHEVHEAIEADAKRN